MRRIALVLGLVAAGVGAWSLHHVRQETATCVPHSAGSAGFGVSTTCLNQVGAEYVSMGVIIAGFFVFLFALLLMSRDKATRHKPIRPERRLIGTPGEDTSQRRLFQGLRAGSSPGASRTATWRGTSDPVESERKAAGDSPGDRPDAV
jgi:hypothetical protein